MPFKQKTKLEFAKAEKRTPDELKTLFEKIEAKDGNWKKVSNEAILKECREKWREREFRGDCEFEFEEFFLIGEETQIVRCKQEQCRDRKVIFAVLKGGRNSSSRLICAKMETGTTSRRFQDI